MKKVLLIISGFALALLLAGAVLAYRQSEAYRLHAQPRREWKDRAIAAIASRAAYREWVATEISSLKAKPIVAGREYESWLSPQLILMENGEWIAYASICSKQDSRIHDIFIGQGSDGKWYYSTYHFCRQMIVLMMQSGMEGQRATLKGFAQMYYLREFDGRSDDCLSKTWPPNRR